MRTRRIESEREKNIVEKGRKSRGIKKGGSQRRVRGGGGGKMRRKSQSRRKSCPGAAQWAVVSDVKEFHGTLRVLRIQI